MIKCIFCGKYNTKNASPQPFEYTSRFNPCFFLTRREKVKLSKKCGLIVNSESPHPKTNT